MEIFLRMLRSNSTTVSEHRRIMIIMRYHNHCESFSDAAKEFCYDRETVSAWYYRGLVINREWDCMVKNALNETGHAGDKLRKLRLAKELLADKPRCGAPSTYTVEQYTAIVKIALQKPTEFERPITNWTARELADEVHKQKIVPGISQRQVQRFLDQADLKPHKSRYWLNPKIDNQEEYERQVKEICFLYQHAQELDSKGIHLISTDEKTGMQALERIAPVKPMLQGKIELIESEYIRHGTLCLIPSFDVATGEIIEAYIGESRNETDFVHHIRKTVSADPDGEWAFICDQLNIHASKTLVETVAQFIGFKENLGIKGKEGILKNVKTRQKFLMDKGHRIRFVYTPKHCSWLNQVEIWFSILARKALKRGNFVSKEDLKKKLEDFISYFNRTMAKPFKWTYKGKPLTA